MFSEASSFNQPLPWDTSRVTNFDCRPYPPRSEAHTCISGRSGGQSQLQLLLCVVAMFFQDDALALFNQPLAWNTSRATTMTSKLPYFAFTACVLANVTGDWQLSIRLPHPSTVIVAAEMFSGCSSFNQLLSWDTRSVIDMSCANLRSKSVLYALVHVPSKDL